MRQERTVKHSTAREPIPRFLTMDEVAEALRVSRATINRWREEGFLPPFLRIGPGRVGRVGLPEEAFRSFLATRPQALLAAHAAPPTRLRERS